MDTRDEDALVLEDQLWQLASLTEACWVVAAEGWVEHEELVDDTFPGRPG